MSRLRPYILLLLLITANSYAQQRAAAWLIYPSQDDSPRIEIWSGQENKHQFIWRMLSSDGTLLFEMPEPSYQKDFSVNQGQCKIHGVFRDDVIAIVKHSENSQWSTKVLRIWVADPKAKSFVPINNHGVMCLYEGYGF